MGTFQDAPSGSLQRSLDDGANAQSDIRDDALMRRIAALEEELASLRAVAREKHELATLVTQLREANQHLVLATVNAQSLRDDAEAANRRQNEFLAMLAHELRNPLAPISMSAALLERGTSSPAQLLSLTQVIRRQVDHMAHLLDDLLDAARISSGKITLSVQPTVLTEVIEQAVETVQPRIKERAQRLHIALPPEPVVTVGDRVRLTQVFTNLLSNASKYTGDRGELALGATLVGGEVVVTITDNGTGIAPEVIPHIFDLFTQGPRSLARSEGGLGVGLNVVRNLVLMHGGRVDAVSAGLGAGSTFTVRLPVSGEALAAGPSAGSASGAVTGRRILLIEDNVDACDTLKHFLVMEGHEVVAAYDGTAGLAAALERPYDVVVCDIGLPGLDGFDVIRQLRQEVTGHRPYAIALSGYCQAEDRARAMDAGFDHYLVKPVVPHALLAVLSAGALQALPH